MVLVAYLLLTVSTLAIHGKPTGDSEDCVVMGGLTYCNKPGSSYPQSEIDRAITGTKNISLNPFMMGPRLINMPDIEEWSVEGNCAVDIIPSFTPYTVSLDGKDLINIVQSKFFKQAIPVVRCNGNNKKEALENQESDDEHYECFKDFVSAGFKFNTVCEQRIITTNLYIYADNEIKPHMAEIEADCVCARKRR